ncbi:MAG: beta-N-acetylglucosaminidase domain-containing protein, partial [Candidatus Roizmanbacteria bacterium]
MKKSYYGIVEGFFSEPLKPWANRERSDILEFIHNYSSLDTYIYCPKDEIYISKKWDILYPQSKALEIEKFIKKCSLYGVTYFYGLNPAINDKTDWIILKEKVVKKIDQILELGCKNICLLFDDIPIAYDVVDGEVKENTIYKSLVDTINDLYLYFQEKCDDCLVCMPDYVFIQKTPLTDACKFLNKDLGICWTGNEIFSKGITSKDITRVK